MRELKGHRVLPGNWRRQMTREAFEAVAVKLVGYMPKPLVAGEQWRCEGHTQLFSCEESTAENAQGVALRVYQVEFAA